ncbi:MAG: hypothetical protein QF687_01545 [Nitrospinaceae bacterium]|jgi:hypothetical protein|nr:hypothetical protein [Nitrospinaceae bacterium]
MGNTVEKPDREIKFPLLFARDKQLVDSQTVKNYHETRHESTRAPAGS